MESEAGFFWPSGRMVPSRETVTAADGSFSFRDLAAGDARFAVRATGFGQLRQQIELRAPTTGGLRFELGEPLVLFGRVVDEAGAPIAGAMVRDGSMGGAGQVTRSAGDGSYRLEPLSTRALRLLVNAEGYRHWYGDVELPADQLQLEHDIVLQRKARLLGRLVDEAETPLGGWVVHGPRGSGIYARVDERGWFELDAVEPPSLVGGMPPAGPDAAFVEPQPLTVDPEPDDDGRRVWRARAADASSVSLRGRIVFDPPLDDPKVMLVLRRPASHHRYDMPLRFLDGPPMGRFESAAWQPGSYRLAIASGPGEVRIPEQEVAQFDAGPGDRIELGDLRVRAAVPFSVDVTRPPGVPATDVRMRLLRSADGAAMPAGLDREGRFRAEPLAPGSYRLVVNGRGFLPVVRDLTLVPAEPAHEAIGLESARSVRLTATGFEGERVPTWIAVEVQPARAGSDSHRLHVLGHRLFADGVEIGLADGEYRLALDMAGSKPVTVRFVPGGDDRAEFRFE